MQKFLKIPLLLSLLSGLLLSAGWPSRGFPLLLLFALVPLFSMEHQIRKDGKKFKNIRVFLNAYLAFFIWNALTTWWIWNSTAEGAMVAIICNSLFMALLFTGYHITQKSLGTQRAYVGLILYWIGFEHFHLNWDLSWPWLQLGNGFAAYPQLVQWYEWFGVMGGSLWILICNLLIWDKWLLPKWDFGSKPFRKTNAMVWIILFLFFPMGGSLVRYFTFKQDGPEVEVVALQPNLDPYETKFNIPVREMTAMLLQWSQPYLTENTRYLVWPETALPYSIWEDFLETDERLDTLRAFCKQYPGLRLMTGAYTLTRIPEGAPVPHTADKHYENFWMDDHNSALEISSSKKILVYHKTKLVPGPEMTPFPAIMKHVQKKWFGRHGGLIGAMAGQTERTVFQRPDSGLRVAPVICYESIYGDFLTGYVRNGANLLAVSTNDAWWGETPGHRQLLDYTRLRAIELRRDIVRSANTGISCLINARGDIIQPLAYSTRGAVRGNVRLSEEITFYAKHGDFTGGFSLLMGCMFFIYSLIFKKLKNNYR